MLSLNSLEATLCVQKQKKRYKVVLFLLKTRGALRRESFGVLIIANFFCYHKSISHGFGLNC